MSANAGDNRETILAVIAGEDPNFRMVFACDHGDGDRPIVLRQESYGDRVGWFPQSSIRMTRGEMAQLRSLLGGQLPRACEQTARMIRSEAEPAIIRMRPISAAS